MNDYFAEHYKDWASTISYFIYFLIQVSESALALSNLGLTAPFPLLYYHIQIPIYIPPVFRQHVLEVIRKFYVQ